MSQEVGGGGSGRPSPLRLTNPSRIFNSDILLMLVPETDHQSYFLVFFNRISNDVDTPKLMP